jgi:hypothetical protein
VKDRAVFAAATVLIASAVAIPGSSRADGLPCDQLKVRPMLMLDAQTCVKNEVDPAKRQASEDWIRAHGYGVKRDELQDGDVRNRADQVFGATFTGDRRVEITAPDGTAWVQPSRKLAAGGGGTLLGGVVALCTTGTVRGHWEITRTAMRAYRGWSTSKAIPQFLPRAVVNVDDHAWRKPEAHAQSDAPDGLHPEGKKSATDRFDAWVDKHMGGLRQACAAPSSVKVAGYELAVLLHAVQDLSTHAGVTNPEHAGLMLAGKNPDGDDARLDRAERWSRLLLDKAGATLGQCVDAVTDLDTNDADTVATSVLGARDAQGGDYAAYVKSGASYRLSDSNGSLHVDWFAPKDDGAADAFLNAHVLSRVH